jgi:hypothetical protein
VPLEENTGHGVGRAPTCAGIPMSLADKPMVAWSATPGGVAVYRGGLHVT